MTVQPCATHVYLLRHGACEGGQIFRGSTDSALSPQGRAQVQQVLGTLTAAAPDAVWSSPLARCSEPARAFCAEHDLPLLEEPALAEIHFGQWEGQPVSLIGQREPERISRFWRDPAAFPPPDGETMADFQARVVAVWQQLLTRQRGKTTLVLTHGGVIRLILAQMLGMPIRPLSYLHVPHACLSHIAVYHSPGKDDWPQLMFHNGGLHA